MEIIETPLTWKPISIQWGHWTTPLRFSLDLKSTLWWYWDQGRGLWSLPLHATQGLRPCTVPTTHPHRPVTQGWWFCVLHTSLMCHCCFPCTHLFWAWNSFTGLPVSTLVWLEFTFYSTVRMIFLSTGRIMWLSLLEEPQDSTSLFIQPTGPWIISTRSCCPLLPPTLLCTLCSGSIKLLPVSPSVYTLSHLSALGHAFPTTGTSFPLHLTNCYSPAGHTLLQVRFLLCVKS